jgi:cyclic dehypoxanthinyl futalosine synthase
MQGGLHPDLKIDWHEKMLGGIRQRFPKIHPLLSASNYCHRRIQLSEHTRHKLRDAGLDSIPGGGAEIDDEVRYKIARLKCLTDDWLTCIAPRTSSECERLPR